MSPSRSFSFKPVVVAIWLSFGTVGAACAQVLTNPVAGDIDFEGNHVQMSVNQDGYELAIPAGKELNLTGITSYTSVTSIADLGKAASLWLSASGVTINGDLNISGRIDNEVAGPGTSHGGSVGIYQDKGSATFSGVVNVDYEMDVDLNRGMGYPVFLMPDTQTTFNQLKINLHGTESADSKLPSQALASAGTTRINRLDVDVSVRGASAINQTYGSLKVASGSVRMSSGLGASAVELLQTSVALGADGAFDIEFDEQSQGSALNVQESEVTYTNGTILMRNGGTAITADESSVKLGDGVSVSITGEDNGVFLSDRGDGGNTVVMGAGDVTITSGSYARFIEAGRSDNTFIKTGGRVNLSGVRGATGVDFGDSNEKGNHAQLSNVDMTVTATGDEETARTSVGFQIGSDAVIDLTDVTVQASGGMTSYGLYGYGQGVVNVNGNVKATGDTRGVYLTSEESALNIVQGAVFETNSVESVGTTTLAESSVLSVTGQAGQTSTLGTVSSNGGEVVLGAGSFQVASFEGDEKRVTIADLQSIEGVTIGRNTGDTTFRTDGANNDRYASAVEAAQTMADVITIENNSDSSVNRLTLEQGAVNDGLTAVLGEDGALSEVTLSKNTRLQALGSITSLGILNIRHEMNSLNQRMGEIRDSPSGVGAWARLYGSENEYGSQGVTARNTTIQVGSDVSVGNWKIGAALSYTNGDATYDAGEGDSDAYGVALYGTWLADNGQFVDLIARYVRMDQDFALDGLSGSYDNNAFALSAEYGWRFELGTLAFVEPQVEFMYYRVQGDDFNTSLGARVEQDDYESYIGRLGVRGGLKFPDNKGTIYARLSYLYDFDGEMHSDVRSTTSAAFNSIDDDLGGSWVEYGVGANFNWTDNMYTYVDLERSSGGEVRENWKWSLGMRYVF